MGYAPIRPDPHNPLQVASPERRPRVAHRRFAPLPISRNPLGCSGMGNIHSPRGLVTALPARPWGQKTKVRDIP